MGCGTAYGRRDVHSPLRSPDDTLGILEITLDDDVEGGDLTEIMASYMAARQVW